MIQNFFCNALTYRFAHFTRKVHAPLVAVAEMNMLKFIGTAPNQQPLQHMYPPILLS